MTADGPDSALRRYNATPLRPLSTRPDPAFHDYGSRAPPLSLDERAANLAAPTAR